MGNFQVRNQNPNGVDVEYEIRTEDQTNDNESDYYDESDEEDYSTEDEEVSSESEPDR